MRRLLEYKPKEQLKFSDTLLELAEIFEPIQDNTNALIIASEKLTYIDKMELLEANARRKQPIWQAIKAVVSMFNEHITDKRNQSYEIKGISSARCVHINDEIMDEIMNILYKNLYYSSAAISKALKVGLESKGVSQTTVRRRGYKHGLNNNYFLNKGIYYKRQYVIELMAEDELIKVIDKWCEITFLDTHSNGHNQVELVEKFYNLGYSTAQAAEESHLTQRTVIQYYKVLRKKEIQTDLRRDYSEYL